MSRPSPLARFGRRRAELEARLERVEEQVKKTHKLVAREAKSAPSRDSAFLQVAQPLRRDRRTLLDLDRLWVLWQAAHNAAQLELPAVEVGSYRGGSAFLLASAFVDALGREVPFDAIDTFEGFPEGALREREVVGGAGFEKTSHGDVVAYLSAFDRLRVLKGEFSTLRGALDAPSYGLVHIDVDLYEPTRDALDFFGPRLARGGVMILDDYAATKWRGVGQAVEEFLAGPHAYHQWHGLTEQLVLTKVRQG